MPVPRKKTTESGPVKKAVKRGKTQTQAVEQETDLNALIARRAYALYEQRGFEHGHDLEDWLKAEKEILMQVSIH